MKQKKPAGNCEAKLYVLQTITETVEFWIQKRTEKSKLGDNINSFKCFPEKEFSVWKIPQLLKFDIYWNLLNAHINGKASVWLRTQASAASGIDKILARKTLGRGKISSRFLVSRLKRFDLLVGIEMITSFIERTFSFILSGFKKNYCRARAKLLNEKIVPGKIKLKTKPNSNSCKKFDRLPVHRHFMRKE